MVLGDETSDKAAVRPKSGKENQVSSATQDIFFRGHFYHSLDSKGRVSLPAEFRKILDANKDQAVVLTNYVSEGARCLDGFSASSWGVFESQLRAKSRFGTKLQKLENFYLSRASHCQVDGNGRILVPTYLRNYAALEKEVVFTSSVHGFRIWDKRVWDLIFQSTEEALLDDPDLFADVEI